MHNIKGLLNLWIMDIQILVKDINLFRLRWIASWKSYKLDNLNAKLNKQNEVSNDK